MNNINVQKKINLLNYTSIKVGGCTEYFSQPSSTSELIDQVRWAKFNNLKCRVIGAGSNLLIKNTLIYGLTICTKKLNAITLDASSGFVEADCGVMLPFMSNLLAKNACKGGEWIIGIPGTVGGAIFMNAGSSSFEISNHLLSVQVIDKETLEIINIDKKDLTFKYRFSIFQENKLILLSAKFNFEPQGNKKLISKLTKENLKIKTESQPYNMPSFGSVFKNPKNCFAGKLIEDLGFKGFQLGGAQVSTMHANFIVNKSNASSEDIYNLITLIQEKILQKKGIFLHPEVRMIGF